jgi:isopenicillin N synthase-like dioxygenase
MTHSIPPDAATSLLADGYLRLPVGEGTGLAIEAAVDAAYAFFRLPATEKISNTLCEDCGYRQTGIEYSQSADRPDPIESFTGSERTRAAAKQLRTAQARLLHDRLLTVFGTLEVLAEALTQQLVNALVGSSHSLALNGAFRRWSCVQANYSRPADTAVDCIHELHEDGHLWTMGYATGPGLEIATPTAGFEPVTTSPREVLVMPGDIARLLSGGHVRPLYHRVRPDRRYRERLALLFFADLAPALCRPWLSNEVNAGIDVGARVHTNAARFGLAGFSNE